MTTPVLTAVKSTRFVAWHYEPTTCELFVRFHPSKKRPKGAFYVYAAVAPEVWEDGQEAESKGSWLIHEIINKPNEHPFREIVEELKGESREEFERDRMGQTGEDNANRLRANHVALMPDGKLVISVVEEIDVNQIPLPIRNTALLPPAPTITLPEILPPDAKEGEEKPFKQIVMERAKLVAAALPMNLTVNSAESYKALAVALVGVKNERIAVEKALATIIQPAIDWKRNYDAWRNEVLALFEMAEERLDTALQQFKRAEAERIRQEEERLRREARETARRQAEAAAEAERLRNQQEAARMEEQAKQRLQDAQEALQAAEAAKANESTSEALFGATGTESAESMAAEAQEEIVRATQDLQEAAELATAPVEIREHTPAPVHVAKPDLKVSGLRAKAAKWQWRLRDGVLNKALREDQPISRLDLRNPDAFPAELWILDKDALSGLVRNMKGRTSIEAIETFDANA